MDLIDRQAAIDALCNNCDNPKAVCPHYPCKQYTSIEALPSAQPEIIRCKDCKYYDAHECKHSRALIFSEDDDFCSHAERRIDETD